MFHWSKKNRNDPKMTNRFRLEFVLGDSTLEIPEHCVKSCGTPKKSVDETTHTFGQITYKFPINVTYDDIEVTLVDIADPDIYDTVERVLYQCGFIFPERREDDFKYISKGKSVDAFDVRIIMLDEEGEEYGRWDLINSWLKVTSPDDLAYEGGKLLEIALTITYDGAIYTKSR